MNINVPCILTCSEVLRVVCHDVTILHVPSRFNTNTHTTHSPPAALPFLTAHSCVKCYVDVFQSGPYPMFISGPSTLPPSKVAAQVLGLFKLKPKNISKANFTVTFECHTRRDPSFNQRAHDPQLVSSDDSIEKDVDLGVLIAGSPIHPKFNMPILKASIWSPHSLSLWAHAPSWNPPHWYSVAKRGKTLPIHLNIILIHAVTKHEVSVSVLLGFTGRRLKQTIQETCLLSCSPPEVAKDPSLPGIVDPDNMVLYAGTHPAMLRICDEWPIAAVLLMAGRELATLKNDFRVSYYIESPRDTDIAKPDWVKIPVLKYWANISPVVTRLVFTYGAATTPHLLKLFSENTDETDKRVLTLRRLCDGLKDEKRVIDDYPFLEMMRQTSQCVNLHIALS